MEIIGFGLIPLLAIGNIITLFFWYQDWKLIEDLRCLLKMKLSPITTKPSMYTDEYLEQTWSNIMSDAEPREKKPNLTIVTKREET